MGKTGLLGAFEEVVLLALLHQGSNAYAVSIRRELSRRSRSDVTMGAVYATLDRLEVKGFVRSRIAEPEEARRGRPRRYYEISPEGAAALDETRRVRENMWDGIELPVRGAGEVP